MSDASTSKMTSLDETQLRAWERDGYLHIVSFLAGAELEQLQSEVAQIERSSDGERSLLQHYEMTAHGVRICRSEHLIDGHPLLRQILTSGPMLEMAGQLLGEPAVLYKEKINYKLSGGAGFAPHQDAPAYPFIDTHTTCMLAIDDATIENGCLDVVAGMHAELLPMDDAGCIRPDLADRMEWQSVPIAAGDLLWFHSRAPHRSGPNTSSIDRRGLFCTYNAASHGDLRERYYAEKLERFATEAAGATTRVSLIGDFQGRAPTVDEIRTYEQQRKEQR